MAHIENTIFDGISKMADVFFNGRRAQPKRESKVPHGETILELARRGTSQVRIDGRRYRITCKEVKSV